MKTPAKVEKVHFSQIGPPPISVLEFQAAVIMKLVGLIDEVSAVQQYFSYHASLNFSLLHFPPTGYTFTFTAALNSAREL